ncbi:hypothetical protein ACFOGJ_18040 [Marinibaculum pumilum]|uniref:Uncharacterized protein n=1 Tax=Marinibaculum pumilum TaxID=1766165 RepID=A0ABV7L3E8_9PROT
MTKRTLRFLATLLGMLLGLLLATGCSEQERREVREHEERMTALEAQNELQKAFRHQELAAETERLRNNLAAETQRQKNGLAADTQRQKDLLAAETRRKLNANLTLAAQIGGIAAVIGLVVGFGLFTLRRLGERHLAERTTRHAQSLKAIQAIADLTAEQRKELLKAAIEAAHRSGSPLISYHGNSGGA